MNSKPKRHSMDSLFTILLLLVFALFALLLAATGSSIYRNGVVHMNENYTSRTAIAYLSEKVRQHNEADAIALTTVEQVPAIAFREKIENMPYWTYVYYYDGSLRELFLAEEREPQLLLGTPLVELKDFSMEPTGKLLQVTATSENDHSLSLLINTISELS